MHFKKTGHHTEQNWNMQVAPSRNLKSSVQARINAPRASTCDLRNFQELLLMNVQKNKFHTQAAWLDLSAVELRMHFSRQVPFEIVNVQNATQHLVAEKKQKLSVLATNSNGKVD